MDFEQNSDGNHGRFPKQRPVLWYLVAVLWTLGILAGINSLATQQHEIPGAESFTEDFQRVQGVLRAVPRNILPSVVQLNISALRDSPASSNFLFDFFNDKNKQKSPDKNPSPRKFRSAVMGSGVIFRQEGDTYFLITNNHVIEDANEIEVISYNERKFPGKVVGRDARVDLAVLSFEAYGAEGLKVATLGESSSLEVGDWVMAVGSPNGFRSSVTMGIVSYIGRHGGPGQNINDFIQTDAAINRGNSGGPLVNMYGQVVGINTWIASESGTSAGLGFAIPIDNTKYIVEAFLKEGRMRYGWLGIVMQEYAVILNRISPNIERVVLSDYGVYGKKGVFITSVYKASPADQAGLRPGDFITEVDGKKISSTDELAFSIGIIPPDQKARLKLLRAGKVREVDVKLGERKEGELRDAKSHRAWPGLDVIPLDQEVTRSLEELNVNFKAIGSGLDTEGLWILRVIPQSTGDLIGLQQNDVITELNGQKVRSFQDFYHILNQVGPDGGLVYTYQRQGKEHRTPKTKAAVKTTQDTTED